jgi:alkanesulfonate monooxygenase SsuD/methylene tetrahydromethanopterin reductase-like flavin-dependent oxidoreductase (luciferase family)
MYPAPLMALAALAGRTQRTGLGIDMLLLPLYHPLQVAEEGAMVDALSDAPRAWVTSSSSARRSASVISLGCSVSTRRSCANRGGIPA